jgi:hypothetical protein
MVISHENKIHEVACSIAENNRQTAMATAVTTAQVKAVDVAFYRAVITSCKAQGLPFSNFTHALWCLGTGGQ